MGTVSLSLPSDGSTGTVSQYNTPLTTLQTEFNGNIDNNNIKASAAIATSKLASDNGITGAMLATSAITLGYASITAASAVNNSATPALVTGLSATVTIPAGGRRIRVTAFAPILYNATVNGQSVITIWDGTVGSGTQIGQGFGVNNGNAGTAGANSCTLTAIVTPAAGSKTYNVGLALSTGSNAQIYAATGVVAYILVEAI